MKYFQLSTDRGETLFLLPPILTFRRIFLVVTPSPAMRRNQNFVASVTGHKVRRIDWISTVWAKVLDVVYVILPTPLDNSQLKIRFHCETPQALRMDQSRMLFTVLVLTPTYSSTLRNTQLDTTVLIQSIRRSRVTGGLKSTKF